MAVSHATIKEGSKGSDVAAWQTILGDVTVDSSFGPKTTASTKKWQTKYGLKNDGVVGPNTWAKAAEVSPTTFKQKVANIAQASVIGVPSKVPAWGWAAAIGAVLTGIAYAFFGGPILRQPPRNRKP
jgi:hypothetical protein